MRILIVEDEVKIRVGLSKLIEAQSGHTIIGEAKNGKEGMEMALRLHPELILTDIRMPLMNGLEMLEQLHRQKLKFHSVLLTGYAEFEYARKAIQLGADNYLLKPIGVEDVQQVLREVEEKILEEKGRIEGTPQGYLRTMLLGSGEEEARSLRLLLETGALSGVRKSWLFLGYMGGTDASYLNWCRQNFEALQKKYPQHRIYSTFIENTQEYLCLIQADLSKERIRSMMEHRIFMEKSKRGMPLWTTACIQHPAELRESISKMRTWYTWAMVLGYDHLITAEEIDSFEAEEFQYPVGLENRLKAEVCKGNREKIGECAKEFVALMGQQRCSPFHIRESYIRIVNFLLNLSSEVAQEGYRLMQELGPIHELGRAVTLFEMQECFFRVTEVLENAVNKKEDIRNYTVNRAISYIREHYQEVISLEEMAGRLDITPEYLSTLFNREMGINFSTFLKKFRVSQAKRLLKGSDMKIYEVANAVGYGDSKYFNRVFREEVGVSPGDYRQS